tara:strand:- start:17781 stop:18857 length:1077 start_codon:yes stop_codon:yes gene_type:complete
MEKQFKPELIPNSKTGAEFELTKNVVNPEDYFCSLKHDGGRVEIKSTGPALSRALKVIPNVKLQQMVAEIQAQGLLHDNDILECEFYAPNMTFSEIMHFFKTEDVTSEHTRNKYEKLWAKTGGDPEKGWKYPGRDVEWLTTWHPELKLYAFNLLDTDRMEWDKQTRNGNLIGYVDDYIQLYRGAGNLKYVEQWVFSSHEEIQKFYDEAVDNGEEGIVIVRRDAKYKFGRHTMNSGNIFKMKEDKLEFDAMILSVEEATEAREGAIKTVNELGRSKTSQLKEDRVPSGIAKGFKVRMKDGREFTVSLNGYNTEEKRQLLQNPTDFVGEWIRFTAMAPTKPGGMPRQARYTAGNIREAKI